MEKRLPMYSVKELNSLDRTYFEIIRADEADVTLISKNTRHIWYIHNAGYPTEGLSIIFHAHSPALPLHHHGKANTLRQAIRSIKSHDKWQMNGRKWIHESRL